MKVLLRKAGIDELETLLQWRMRVLQEVFFSEEYEGEAPAERHESEVPADKHENEAPAAEHQPEAVARNDEAPAAEHQPEAPARNDGAGAGVKSAIAGSVKNSAGADTNISAELYANNKRYYEQHLADGSYTACFAIDQASGKILGCGGICYQEEMPSPDNMTGTNGYLMNIYSVPECRGQGVGRQIIEFLIQDAKSRGTEKIYLESSDMAKQLYYEIGFSDMQNYMQLSS